MDSCTVFFKMFFYINLSNNCDNKYKFMHFFLIFFHYILLKLSMWQQYKSQTTGHRKKHWTMTVQVTFDKRWKIIIMQCCLKWYIFFILQYIRKHLRAIHLDIYSVASLFQLVLYNRIATPICGSLMGAEKNFNSITWEKIAAPGAQPVVQLPINSQDNFNELWHSVLLHLSYTHAQTSR